MPGPRTRVRLRAQPGAPRARVVGRPGERWTLRAAAAPERGRTLASPGRVLAVPRSPVALVSGSGARDKIVEVTGVGPEHVDRRLAEAGGRGSQ